MNTPRTYEVTEVERSKFKDQVVVNAEGQQETIIQFLTPAKTAPRVLQRLTVNISWDND
jgi:hypothetical protein